MAILAIGKLRDAVNKMVKGNPRSMDHTMTPRMLLGLLNEAEKIGLPEPAKPEWPKFLYGKYAGKKIPVGTQERFDKLLKLGCWVKDPSLCERPYPRVLWLGEKHRLAYNKYEEVEFEKAGWKEDESKPRPVTYSRPSDTPGMYESFLLQCEDQALRAFVELKYRNAAGTAQPSSWTLHLTDVLSEYYFPIPKETED